MCSDKVKMRNDRLRHTRGFFLNQFIAGFLSELIGAFLLKLFEIFWVTQMCSTLSVANLLFL